MAVARAAGVWCSWRLAGRVRLRLSRMLKLGVARLLRTPMRRGWQVLTSSGSPGALKGRLSWGNPQTTEASESGRTKTNQDSLCLLSR